MIRPKDCTKEELLFFIENSMIYSQSDFDYKIKVYRSDKYSEMAQMEQENANKCMEEYMELSKKYDGCKYADIPKEDIIKMAGLSEKAQKYYKKSEDLWKKSFKLN